VSQNGKMATLLVARATPLLHLQKNFVARAITFLQVQYPTPLRN
jgi:hypothetical protein